MNSFIHLNTIGGVEYHDLYINKLSYGLGDPDTSYGLDSDCYSPVIGLTWLENLSASSQLQIDYYLSSILSMYDYSLYEIVTESSNFTPEFLAIQSDSTFSSYSSSQTLVATSNIIEPYSSITTNNDFKTFGVLNYPPTVEGDWETEFSCTLNEGPARCDDLQLPLFFDIEYDTPFIFDI